MSKPIVLLPLCRRQGQFQKEYYVSCKYVEAVKRIGCIPLALPSLIGEVELQQLLTDTDSWIAGVVLTGSRTNVNPKYYGVTPDDYDRSLLDDERDQLTTTLIKLCLQCGVPLLAICRGHQEVNVAFGGSLYRVSDPDYNKSDHRQVKDVSWDDSFNPRHMVSIQDGGILAQLLSEHRRFEVNSLHEQGINQLSPSLRVEAVSDDGVIEAVSHPDAKNFFLGVQWHPEHPFVFNNKENEIIWQTFLDAVTARYHATHRTSEPLGHAHLAPS